MALDLLHDDDLVRDLLPGVEESDAGGVPLAPRWPAGILPPDFERYTATAARSIGVPVEMVAVPLLVTAGATIGNRLHIVLKRGFTQSPTLYAAVIGEPGTAKSPATLAAQWPLHRLQEEHVTAYRVEKTVFEADLEAWSATPKDERGSKPLPPEMHHLYSSDLTIEALVSMLARMQGVAILRDEILSWISSMDQYRGGKGSDRQQYLSLWAGSPIKADRKGAESLFVSHPVAGVYGGIQPDALGGLHDRDGKRDGFIERVLLFFPDVRPSGWTDDDLDPALVEPLVEAFRSIRRIGSPGESFGVQLSREARETWRRWYNENAAAIGSASGLRRGFYSKLPNQVARIALILNTLWNTDDPQRLVSEDRMSDAIAVGEYFRGHLDRVLPLIGQGSTGSGDGVGSRVLRILRIDGATSKGGWVRRGVIIEKLGNVLSEELTAALEALETDLLVERRMVPTATRPAEEWRLVDRDGQGPGLAPGEEVF